MTEPLYYMRDDHTFVPLPDNDVETAIALLRGAYLHDGYTHGMLCTKRAGAPPSVHAHGRARWEEFEAAARQWLSAVAAIPREPVPAGEPLPGTLVVAALLAMDAEARKRGEMFPQTAEEQRESSEAVRKVISSVEFYTSVRQSRDGWPLVKDWPALPTERTPALEQLVAQSNARADHLADAVRAMDWLDVTMRHTNADTRYTQRVMLQAAAYIRRLAKIIADVCGEKGA